MWERKQQKSYQIKNYTVFQGCCKVHGGHQDRKIYLQKDVLWVLVL